MVEILIWITAIFAAGSFLVLERRCLGQRALVQPLALCLIVGWYVGNVETGLWLGISLQLLSLGPSRIVDWALASAVASTGLLVSSKLGMRLEVGSPSTSILLFIPVLSGMLSRYVERNFARWDREKVEVQPPWREPDPAHAVEKSVYRAILRWFFIGGLEVLVSLGVALMAIAAASQADATPAWLTHISSVGIPAVGIAVVLTALTGKRFIVWAGAAACATMIFVSTVAA